MESTETVDLPLYNSRIIDTYLKLVKRRYSYINISELLGYADMDPGEVADQDHWFTQEQIDRFHERLVKLTGNSGIAREAGRYAASPEVMGPLRQYLIKVIGPAKLFAYTKSATAKLTRSSLYESKRISVNSVELTVTPGPDAVEKPFQCENRIGFFEAVPLMFNHTLPEVRHPECIFKGGKVCRYIITWEKSPSEIWKTIFALSAFCLVVLCLVLFFLYPVVTQMYIIPLAAGLLMVISLILSGVVKKELEKSLANHMDSKEQLYDQININYNNTLMTNEIGQAISRETDRESILHKVVRIIEKRLDYDRGVIFLATRDKGRLIFQTGFGYSEEQFGILRHTVLDIEKPAAACMLSSAFQNQRPFLINEAAQSDYGKAPGSFGWFNELGTHAVLCCPIICEGESLGILAVGNPRTKRPFIDSDISLLMGIAQIIGISITNSMRVAKELLMHEQLRQAQKMELIGRLAGGISHDFNNLLTIIIGYSDILLKRLGENAPHYREVQGINNAGKRAADLTHQLLAYSRRQVLQPKVLDLNTIIADVSRMLRRLINEDIELIITAAEKLWWIKADPGQMGQVIVNLALNARDAMPRGGKLTIATENVNLDQAFCGKYDFVKAGCHVMMTVRDTGHGMDEITKSHIFEPFFTTKQVGKGTGLGLATVYGIIKQSGGYIFVDSEPGEGTIFRIYMPMADEAMALEIRPKEHIPQENRAESVLVVEDEDAVREFVCEILRANGYDVLEASDGVAALQLCRTGNKSINLLLTDVIMPEMGGHELAKEIIVILPKIKILFMSGYTDDAIAHHGVLNPHTSFIGKPFTPGSLIHKVRTVLEGGHDALAASP